MAYEIKKDERGRVAVYKDGELIGFATETRIEKDEKRVPAWQALYGDATESEYAELRKTVKGDGFAVMKVVFDDEITAETENFLENYLGKSETLLRTGEKSVAIIKSLKKGEDLSAPRVYAKILSQATYEEFGKTATVGVGEIVSDVEELSLSYRQASDAIELNGKKTGDGCVFPYAELVFGEIVGELTEEKAIKKLHAIMPESALAVFNDEELFRTAQTFLTCNLNLSETARKLFLHRNTLSYRLERIERITGLNIKNYADALAFSCACELYKKIGKRAL